jgi:hypothetical protein
MDGILTDIRFIIFPVLTKKPPGRFLGKNLAKSLS